MLEPELGLGVGGRIKIGHTQGGTARRALHGGRLEIGEERVAEALRASAAAATALTAAAAAAVATSAEVAEPRLRTGRFSGRWKTGESPP